MKYLQFFYEEVLYWKCLLKRHETRLYLVQVMIRTLKDLKFLGLFSRSPLNTLRQQQPWNKLNLGSFKSVVHWHCHSVTIYNWYRKTGQLARKFCSFPENNRTDFIKPIKILLKLIVQLKSYIKRNVFNYSGHHQAKKCFFTLWRHLYVEIVCFHYNLLLVIFVSKKQQISASKSGDPLSTRFLCSKNRLPS